MRAILLLLGYVWSVCIYEISASSFNKLVAENELDSSRTHPVKPKSPASVLHDEVDILKLINITIKDQGVSLVEGPIAKYPAYKFRLNYGNGPLANSSLITNALSGIEGFTLVFLFRQQKNNLGALISVNSPGRLIPWLQLTTKSRTGFVTFKYKTNLSKKLHQIDWPMPAHGRNTPLASWTWLSLTVDYSTGTLRLDVDCQPSKFELLDPRSDRSRISVPQESIVYFRQEPGRKKKFLGSIQVAKILPYVTQQRLWTCMHIAENPIPEYRKPLL